MNMPIKRGVPPRPIIRNLARLRCLTPTSSKMSTVNVTAIAPAAVFPHPAQPMPGFSCAD